MMFLRASEVYLRASLLAHGLGGPEENSGNVELAASAFRPNLGYYNTNVLMPTCPNQMSCPVKNASILQITRTT